jgi:hypothetical protein
VNGIAFQGGAGGAVLDAMRGHHHQSTHIFAPTVLGDGLGRDRHESQVGSSRNGFGANETGQAGNVGSDRVDRVHRTLETPVHQVFGQACAPPSPPLEKHR